MGTLRELVESKGGVARTAALVTAGHRRAAIAAAVAAGDLRRVRRGWVATPDADPDLVAAARAGVVLSCITQARRQGLWALAEDRPHVAAPPHAGRVRAGNAHVHRAVPVVPRHPGRLEDEIENVLSLVATCQPYEVALAIVESALDKRLVDKAAFARLPLPPAARRICADASPFAEQ